MALDMNAALRAVSIASLVALKDYRFSNDDIFFRLLHDIKVQSFISKNELITYDVKDIDFVWNLGKFALLVHEFSEKFLALTDELEEDIRIVLDHQNGLKSSSGEIVSKKTVSLVLLDLLNDLMDGEILMKKDFEKITSAGLIQTNFCRWVHIYSFLRPSHQFKVLNRFKNWVKEWSLSH